MNYQELRKQYNQFIYHDFRISENDVELNIEYSFEIVGLSFFAPTYRIKKKNKNSVGNKKIVKQLIFSLGLVELISYWKLTCAPTICVKCGSLSDEQIAWWKKLYYHGLGEFFYINEIEPDFNALMNILADDISIEGSEFQQEYIGNLIPVGGGKDSFVSLEILKDQFELNHAFVINQVMSAIHASEAAGYKDQLIQITRTLDQRMLRLNSEGFLNGHTPFSAMVAFSSVLTAVLYGKKYVCLSNESSANESTVLNNTVNHQYSKSYEFEVDFNQYLSKYILDDIKYFSLLRPLSELQITCIFSTLKDYLEVFKSCNVGSKKEIWCCHCAKCLFVYVMLSAFLDNQKLVEIFGEDLLENDELWELLKELSGISENKPFECVGTRDEVNQAIAIMITRYNEKNMELPLLYKKYTEKGYYHGIMNMDKLFLSFNDENLVPKVYIQLIKHKVEECYHEIR